MDAATLRKPRNYFDTAPRPLHVTFDDGDTCRNFPWLHYVEARWKRAEPDAIKLYLGDVLVLITGHQLWPLYLAISNQTLVWLTVQPELAKDPEREPDSFATRIQFLRLADLPAIPGQMQLELGTD